MCATKGKANHNHNLSCTKEYQRQYMYGKESRLKKKVTLKFTLAACHFNSQEPLKIVL